MSKSRFTFLHYKKLTFYGVHDLAMDWRSNHNFTLLLQL